MNIGKIVETLKPFSEYCRDNKIPQPVFEVDIVRDNKVWVCCRSGNYLGTAIGDIYEDVLLKATEKFVANCSSPYKN